MLNADDAKTIQKRLDAVEARALEVTGAEYALASVMIRSASRMALTQNVDTPPYHCRVGLGPVKTTYGNAYPKDIETLGECPLSAIEAAFAELKARSKAQASEAA